MTQFVLGENFMPAFSTTGEKLLDLSFKLVRNCTPELINNDIEEVFSQVANRSSESSDFIETLVNLFVLAFSTRDCRGGKGEKAIFYSMLLKLYKIHPLSAITVLKFIPHFGYYKDFLLILNLLNPEDESTTQLSDAIIKLLAEQLKTDHDNLSQGKSKLSLAAKYFPREGKKFAKKNPIYFKKLVTQVNSLIPSNSTISELQNYRQILAKITQLLDVPETLMCGKRFASIAFSNVPSLCLNRHTSAFLNEKLKVPPTALEQFTGNRFPLDEDRVQARQNFINTILSDDKKINASQLFPHEVIKPVFNRSSTDGVKKLLAQKQWTSLKDSLISRINEYLASTGAKPFLSFENIVPLVDVSGSMSGIPMEVAVALGILISELNHPVFRDSFISFESSPQWIHFDKEKHVNVIDKATYAISTPWGGSTNFIAAIDLIIEKLRSNAMKEEEIPDLIVFSDMQFNEADSKVDITTEVNLDLEYILSKDLKELTATQIIRKKFAQLGLELENRPFRAPRIIYWNLRASVGFPATSSDPNITLLAGFSPSLFKYLFAGEEAVEEEYEVINENGEVEKKKAQPNPLDGLKKMLQDPRYFNIRTEFSDKSNELFGSDKAYKFTAPEVTSN